MAFDPQELEQLFQEGRDEQTLSEQPERAPEPQPAPTPEPPRIDPNIVALQQQVGQLTNMVTGLFQQGFQRPAPEARPDPLTQPAKYFTDADVNALLTAEDKSTTFNVLADKIRQNVAAPLLERLEQTTQRLSAFEQQQLAERRRAEISQEAARNHESFMTAYPDLKGMDDLVAMEASRLDQAARANPQMLMGRSNTELAAMLAEQVRSRVKGIVDRANGSTDEPARPAPVRSAFMERGGTSRAPAPAKSKDPNTAALTDMANYLGRRNQRRSA